MGMKSRKRKEEHLLKTRQFNIRIPKHLKAKMKIEATKRKITTSEYFRLLVQHGLDKAEGICIAEEGKLHSHIGVPCECIKCLKLARLEKA